MFRFFSEPAYRYFLFLVFLHSGKKRFTVYPVKFHGLKLKVRDSLSFVWQYWDIFVEEFYFFKSKKNNPVIYDLGSNIGMSIIYFKKIYPGATIYAFEPEESLFEILNYNLSSDNSFIQNIYLNKAAIWTHNNGVILNASDSDSSSITSGSANSANSYKAKSLRLNDLLLNHETVDFLKIDIEGAETEVMLDCEKNLDRVLNMFIEYHSFPGKSQNLDILLGILKKQGFRVQINSPFRYKRPFSKKYLHPFPEMDLQINIFAFRDLPGKDET